MLNTDQMEYECAFPFDEETVEAILAAEEQIVFALNQEGELHACPEMGMAGGFNNFDSGNDYFREIRSSRPHKPRGDGYYFYEELADPIEPAQISRICRSGTE